MSDHSDNSQEFNDDDMPWIKWFCSLNGNEFFCEVDEEYIQDEFNLTGLSIMVPFYEYALDMVLDLESPGEDELTKEQQQMAEDAAEVLYGLIHARFILTQKGFKLMDQKYRVGKFGKCPRVLCNGQNMLPCGQSDVMRESSVKLYCPRCNDIFLPPSSKHKNLDGVFWGTSFPHLFLLAYPEVISTTPLQQYEPKVFGFKMHPSNIVTRKRNGEDDPKDGKSESKPEKVSQPFQTKQQAWPPAP
jgi:casein kinase II subunit beta